GGRGLRPAPGRLKEGGRTGKDFCLILPRRALSPPGPSAVSTRARRRIRKPGRKVTAPPAPSALAPDPRGGRATHLLAVQSFAVDPSAPPRKARPLQRQVVATDHPCGKESDTC